MNNQIRILPGAEGIKQAYELVLKAKRADIICLSQNYEAVIGDYFDKTFAPALYGRVRTREILPDTIDNRDYAKTKQADLNQVRFTGMKLTETDFIVTDSAVVLISFDARAAAATVIEEAEMVKFMGNLYEEMWERVGK